MKPLTTPEVAKILGVSVSRVQALIKEHRLPARRFGRDLVVLEEDLVLVSSRLAGRTPAQLQRDYWTTFRDFVVARSNLLHPPTPKALRYMVMETHRGWRLAANVHVRDLQLWVDLTFGRHGKKYFERLEQDRDSIEEEIGAGVEWAARAGGVESWILIRKRADPADRNDWRQQHSWLCEKLERFSNAIRTRPVGLK